MQKWEYYSVMLKRIPTPKELLSLQPWGDYEHWTHYDREAQEWVSANKWWLNTQRELGEAGWELVSAVSVASGYGEDYCGNTTELLFYFKRPIPESTGDTEESAS